MASNGPNKNIDRTGWDKTRCWAKSRRSGNQCQNRPIKGSSHCRMHGGSTRVAKEAAARTVEQEKLTRVARRLGTPHTDLDPAQALLDLVASKAGEVEWLRHQVELLETDGELWWGTTKHTEGVNSQGMIDETTTEARQHIVYTLLHKAQDQLARYAGETLKAGVDERQVRIAERTGEQFEAVITALLPAIGATPEQMKLAAAEIPKILRNVGGGPK
ncbi:HGGxSTG domain-containing protein [Brevibacterium aurantiacum]|uniref:Uncharacterized protein n=1 Tax=Brevibacterium aurantiacum TaxID=273384 RepID=A0A556C5A6_BREAU|nr:HGGxSTG domain-containing protein [Brevibacterium aurantiacum]TSI12643.1 hypothetical protein FO013_19405 [Brevibacterium aurantiacum]